MTRTRVRFQEVALDGRFPGTKEPQRKLDAVIVVEVSPEVVEFPPTRRSVTFDGVPGTEMVC